MIQFSKRTLCLFFSFSLLVITLPCFSEEAAEKPPEQTDDLAKKSQNPVSGLISLPLQNSLTPSTGPNNEIQNTLNIQPVIPVKVGPLHLINRVILPIVTQPTLVPGGNSATGLGDINYQLFFSPAKAARFVWGAGPITIFPSATDTLTGQGKLSVGPTAVALGIMGPWVGGLLINNVWSVAGDSSRAHVNQMLMQPFVNYNFKKGWFLSTAPILTSNWQAPNNTRWTVPIGGGGGRVFKIGSQAVSLNTQFFYNALRTPGLGSFTWRLNLAFLFPR